LIERKYNATGFDELSENQLKKIKDSEKPADFW